MKGEENSKKRSFFKKVRWRTTEYIERIKKLYEKTKKLAKETPEETKLYEKWVNIVKESYKTNNPDRKFRLEHIERLNTGADITFVYGKKGIGKSWELARLVRKMRMQASIDSRKEGKEINYEFLFIRNRQQDEDGVINMFQDEIWPVYLEDGFIYWKEQEKPGQPKRNKGISQKKLAGYFGYTTGQGFEKWQGGSYPNVRLIIWDECNDIKGGGLNEDTLRRFCVLQSSFIRDKKDKESVKTYMFGNHLDNGEDNINMFLSRLGIGTNARLKFIDEYSEENPKELISRILYLNTTEHYKGIESQQGLATQFLSQREKQGLYENKPISLGEKEWYDEDEVNHSIPLTSLVFKIKENGESIKYISYFCMNEENKIICWVEKFHPRNIKNFYVPFTNDPTFSNFHQAPVLLAEEEWVDWLDWIFQILSVGEMYFGYNGSSRLFEKIWLEDWSKLYKQQRNRERNYNRQFNRK